MGYASSTLRLVDGLFIAGFVQIEKQAKTLVYSYKSERLFVDAEPKTLVGVSCSGETIRLDLGDLVVLLQAFSESERELWL